MSNLTENNSPPKFPPSLRVLAWLFLVLGMLALFTTVNSFLSGRPNLDFNIIFMVVGYGLLQKKELWRKFALALSFVVFTFYTSWLFFTLSGIRPLPESLPTRDVVIYYTFSILASLTCVWAMWVLTRKNNVSLFK